MGSVFDLAGIGIGPFNLSLAAVSERDRALKTHFFEQKPLFSWHSEIIFPDSDMQTSFFKDLVTCVDPTSPYSFLNYLVQSGLFYSFVNTKRDTVTRREFEIYCQWVTRQMEEKLSFESRVESLRYDGELFTIETTKGKARSRNICIGTGISPKIPGFSESYISDTFFHAKSGFIEGLDICGKHVAIIGGGQTGVEVFRNALRGGWGSAKSITLVSSRPNLQPLDESPFTNEYFSPNYVEDFFTIHPKLKEEIVDDQKLASDGNTPVYLQNLYNDLYFIQNVDKQNIDFRILPYRRLEDVERCEECYKLRLSNNFTQAKECLHADIVILCTGFENKIPEFIKPIEHLIEFDERGCFKINKDFSVQWKGHGGNKIYAQNFSRYRHGIFEPQTSLMAWRSAVITNSVSQKEVYQVKNLVPSFLSYESIK